MAEYPRPFQNMTYPQMSQWLERHWPAAMIKGISVDTSGYLTIVTDPPVYADNAAAVAGGLTVGQIYRTGDALKIVHS